jgi:predicted DNA-binding protein
MSYLEDIEDISAAEEALRKIESGEDSVIGLDEFLRHDVAG